MSGKGSSQSKGVQTRTKPPPPVCPVPDPDALGTTRYKEVPPRLEEKPFKAPPILRPRMKAAILPLVAELEAKEVSVAPPRQGPKEPPGEPRRPVIEEEIPAMPKRPPPRLTEEETTRPMVEKPKEVEEDPLSKFEKELQAFEEHARRRQELAEKRITDKSMRLLSYEDGFTWCYECKHVSTISSTSDLKYRGLKGCQQKSCSKCFQWKRTSPYEDSDFLYEGDKVQRDCQWYVSGKGCEDGNRCIYNHPKWDESLPENKRRC